jgi:hypothetical protein
MHILHCCVDSKYAGTDQSFLQYTRVLVTLGHTVTAVVHPKFRFIRELEELDIRYFSVGAWFAGDPIAAYRFKSMVEHIQPDMCIAHHSRTSRIVAASRMPVPVIAMAYDPSDRKVYQAQHVVAANRSTAEALLQDGVSVKNITVQAMPMMATPEAFTFSWKKLPAIGLFVDDTGEAGVYGVVKQLESLHNKSIDFEICVASTQAITKSLKERIKLSKLAPQVRYFDKLRDRSVFYNAVDILYFGSKEEIRVSEAMAFGKVVMMQSGQKAKDKIDHGNNGLLISEKDGVSLAYQLETLLASEKNARFLAENAYNCAHDLYSITRLKGVLSPILESSELAYAA